jgi:hypothetical protein
MVSEMRSRAALRSVLAALVIAAICWYFGVDVWHALLLGTAITVIFLAVGVATSASDAALPSWRASERRGADGSRKDVETMAWSLRGSWGRIGLTAERELRRIARRRLALEGLDLSNPAHRPAIEALVGAPVYQVLTRERWGRLSLRTLGRTLDALDQVNSNYYPQTREHRRSH